MQLDWETDARGGVTLVSLQVTNPDPEPQRVRVANCLDGSVWFPRRQGVPEAGWDDGGYEGIVPPGGTRPLGYASPGPPETPPAEIAWTEQAAPTAEQPSAAGVFQSLGDPRPPRDAVVGPAADPIPDAVAAWLSAVTGRLDADDERVRPVDRRALDAVADRIERLRGRFEGR